MAFLREFTEENWIKDVAQSDRFILIDFQAPGQAPLHLPAMADMAQGLWKDRVLLGYADISKLLPVALFYRIHSFPTLCLFHHGKIVKAWQGPDRVERMMDSHAIG